MSIPELNKIDIREVVTDYFDKFNFSQVVETCDQYFNNFGIDEYLLSLKGMALLELNSFHSAIDTFNMLIDLNQEELSYFYYRGLASYRLERYSEAILDFMAVVDSNKSSANAYYYLAYSYYKQGNISEATELINKSIKINTKKYDALYLRGNINFEKSLYNLARIDFSKCLSIDKKDIELYLLRGNSYYLNDQKDLALRDYSKYLKAGGGNSLAFIRRACCLCSKGELINAMKDISVAEKLEGASINVLKKRQCILGKMKKYEEAILDLNQIVAMTGDIDLKFNMSKYLVNLKRFDEALVELNNLIASKNANSDYYMLRAKVLYYLNDYERALLDFDLAFKFNSSDYLPIRWKALIYEKSKNFELALDNFNLAISLSIDDVQLRVDRIKSLMSFNKLDLASDVILEDLGSMALTEKILPLIELAVELFYKMKDYDGSIKFSNMFLNLSSKFDYNILRYKAFSLFELKNYTTAIDCFEQLLVESADVDILLKLGRAYIIINLYDDSIRVLSDLIRIDGDNIEAYYLRGVAYYSSENYHCAMRDFNFVISNSSAPLWGYFRRGNLKFKLGDIRGAINDQTSALLIDSNFAQSYFARGLAYCKLGKIDEGCLDLGKAGELGIVESYELIKKYS